MAAVALATISRCQPDETMATRERLGRAVMALRSE
jgi:hypothetical protein